MTLRRRPKAPYLLVICALAACAATAAPARADVFYDVSVGLKLSDDARIFLNITNEHYAPPPAVATALVKRCPVPEDDYPVVLFVAGAVGRPPGSVLDLRLGGLSWADVFLRLNVPARVLFAGLKHDPGPPYGKAWGHFRKHRPGKRLVLSDRDIVELAKLQIAARHYGVSPHTIVAERKKGVSIERYAARQHRAAHGRAKADRARHEKGASGRKGGKPKRH